MSWIDIWNLACQGKLPKHEGHMTRDEHSFVTSWMQKHEYDKADLLYINDNYMILGIKRQ